MNAFEQLQADMNLFERTSEDIDVAVEALAHSSPIEPEKPPTRHCSCGTDVVGAWDNKVKLYRWFVPTPRRGQFLIRRKSLPGWGTPWQATWWGSTGGAYSVHECDGRVPDGWSWGHFGIGDAEDYLAREAM